MASSPELGPIDSVDHDETAVGAPRIGHKKSRNGCAQCKRRHVKCNEAKPCANCVRHGVACSLAGGPNVPRDDLKTRRRSPADSTLSTATTTTTTSMTESESFAGAEYRGASPLRRLTRALDRQIGFRNDQSWLSDLRLMHHFDTHAQEFLPEPDLLHIWKVEVPRLAFSSQYVMHILLGLSALHMANEQPQHARLLQTSAVSQLDQALTAYREEESTITAANAEQQFCFSFLVCLFAFAVPISMAPIDALCENFTLVQGVDVVATEAFSWLALSPLAALMNVSLEEVMRTAPDNGVTIPPGMELGIGHLDYMLVEQSLTPEANKSLAIALQELKSVYSNVVQAQSAAGVGLVVCWPKMETTRFSRMLKDRVPQALIILAYYCVVLHLLDHKWYLRGWGSRVLENVVAHLDGNWKRWIAWPIRSVLVGNSATSPVQPSLDEDFL